MAETQVAVKDTPLNTLFSIVRSTLYKPTSAFSRLITWAKICLIGFSQRHKRCLTATYYRGEEKIT